MPLANDLTAKQKQFVKEYLKDGNGVQAVIRTGRTQNPHSAGVIAAQSLANARVQETLRQALERRGLTADKLAQKLDEGLDATATIHASKDGVITDLRELKDFQERRKTVELIAKLRGDLSDGLSVTVNAVLAQIPEEFADFMALTPEEIIDVFPESEAT